MIKSNLHLLPLWFVWFIFAFVVEREKGKGIKVIDNLKRQTVHNPNILHIDTINADWCDKDIVLLHACFQLLTDCIEKENLNDTTDWTQDDKFATAKLEIDELYNWWKERIKRELDGKLDPIWTDKQYEQDNEMLIRLIKVRKYLWT